MNKRLVIALGGNALGNNAEEQLELVKGTAKTIVDLSERGYDIIVGHGNGPQVGMINLAMEFSANNGGKTPYMPFPECGAMSQGYIGYHLQQAIQQELHERGIDKECATVVTQVVVDENDPGFQHPTKPVGSFYSKEDAERIAEEKGFTFVEDAGRGYRRVVPS
ncbi:MAG: carbamate kinase, partial [Erysipelotrichales bacterium]|nr:carbamate kinase [Erysipelotrichales bacterium]